MALHIHSCNSLTYRPCNEIKRTVITSDIPLNCIGVDSKTILKHLPESMITHSNYSKVCCYHKEPDEWNRNRQKKPKAQIMPPMRAGFILPNLDMIKQEQGTK
jgi:hypothetical protein